MAFKVSLYKYLNCQKITLNFVNEIHSLFFKIHIHVL